MKSISTDIANTVNITLRRNDSFYLKVDLTNEDGSIYVLSDEDGTPFTAFLDVYSLNDEPVLGFSTEAFNYRLVYRSKCIKSSTNYRSFSRSHEPIYRFLQVQACCAGLFRRKYSYGRKS